ncbi:MAG: arginase family protein [Myxococcota bacterium]
MRLVPVLFPCDLGHSAAGRYEEGGERGAPDMLLDVLEGEGVRFAPPLTVSVPVPSEDDPEDAPLKFDGSVTEAVVACADAVEQVNANGDFPIVLGGDHLGLLGQVLGHSRNHPEGIGLGVLCDAILDMETPAPPALGDVAKRKDPAFTSTGDAERMVLAAAMGLLPEDTALGKALQTTAVQPELVTVAGVRAPMNARVKASAKASKADVWTMERIELDGESSYRAVLLQHLAMGPTILSIDVGGLDPHLMTAVRDPVSDGLDWAFLRRTLEQCLPHVDRILGLDICQLDPTRDDAHKGALSRFAETIAPMLRRLTR